MNTMLRIFLDAFNPPIQPGANAFIWIVILLAAFAATLIVIDQLKEKDKTSDELKDEKEK